MSRVHVVGAGLAGLAAAVTLTRCGRPVALYEAAPQAGGRCRSLFDATLGRTIDNGGHVILGANRAAIAYLDAIGARDRMREIAPAAFPFLDLRDNRRWTLRPNAGPLPWWVLAPGRRVPDSRVGEYAAALRLVLAGPDDSVADCLPAGSPLVERLWLPLATAVLNAHPRAGAARPLGRMLRETFGRGEAGCRPWLAAEGLSHAFVDPALTAIAAAGGQFHAGWRLTGLAFDGDHASALEFADRRVTLASDESAILALPPGAAATLVPGLTVPDESEAIVNAHFRLDGGIDLPGGLPILGLVGAEAQWLIARGDVVSVTVSAANRLVDLPADELLARLWRDVARALARPESPRPPARLIKERRATFAQTPAAQRRRPATATGWRNLFLAGDWTDTGLPASIEGAIRSGVAAAAAS